MHFAGALRLTVDYMAYLPESQQIALVGVLAVAAKLAGSAVYS